MKACRSQPENRKPSDTIEFAPREEVDRAQRQIERLQKENERLKQEIERLRQELEAALRASKRQAAPHSRGKLKLNPQPPGRKAGRAYGRRACRPLPPRVDEKFDVPLPARCPHCRGGVELKRRAPQYQEEIVRRTVVRRFNIAVGRCRRCGRQVQGRHPLQTSEAMGIGSVQLGPEALTLAAVLMEAQLDRRLEQCYRHPANRRLARHLEHERPWLFTFLYCPGLDATNHAAERAIRGMVIARKVWGGNRTGAGARTQQILVSVLRTCWQQGKDAFARLVLLLRSPSAETLDLVPGDG